MTPLGAGVLLVLTGCATALGSAEPPGGDGPLPVRAIAAPDGAPCCRDSGFADPVELVVRSPTEWQAAWRSLGAARPGERAPAVDFRRDMVLVVATGTRPTGGWSIAVERVVRTGGALRVDLVESSPGPTCLVMQMLTHPAAVVAVPRAEGPVTFSRRTEVRVCR